MAESSDESESDTDRCVTSFETELDDKYENQFIAYADGEKRSYAGWKEPEEMIGEDSGAEAIINGNKLFLNKGAKSTLDSFTVMHELGHNLGYRHPDPGIMGSVGRDDGTYHLVSDLHPDVAPHPPTKDIAQTYDAFRYIEWSLSDIRFLINEFAKGKLSLGRMRWAIRQWSNGGVPAVYFIHSWDGFGCMYGKQETGDAFGLPIHQYHGYFYGWPYEKEKGNIPVNDDRLKRAREVVESGEG